MLNIEQDCRAMAEQDMSGRATSDEERAEAASTGPLPLDRGLLFPAVLFAVYAVAVWQRRSGGFIPVHIDLIDFLGITNELAYGLPQRIDRNFLYTSVPYILFGAVTRVFSSPFTALSAWMMLEAFGAVLTTIVVRNVAGLPAGLLAGLIVAFSPTDIQLSGIQSPYLISSFSACMAIGLRAGALKKPYGPVLAVGGAAMMAAMHLGTAVMALVACAFALFQALRLPRRQALLALAAALVAGCVVLGLLVHFDLERLTREMKLVVTGVEPPPRDQPMREMIDRIMRGIGLYERELYSRGTRFKQVVALFVVAGLAWRCSRLARGWWRKRNPAAESGSTPESKGVLSWLDARDSAGVGPVLITIVLGAVPFARLMLEKHYIEHHHLAAFLPLLLMGLAGGVRWLFAGSWRWWVVLAPALVLGSWLNSTFILRRFNPLHVPTARMAVLAGAEDIARPIRDDARRLHREPWVFTFLPPDLELASACNSFVLNELARFGWPAGRLEDTCYLVTTPALAAVAGASRLVATLPAVGLELRAWSSCEEMQLHQEVLCGTPGASVRGRRKGGMTLETDEVLPCVAVDR